MVKFDTLGQFLDRKMKSKIGSIQKILVKIDIGEPLVESQKNEEFKEKQYIIAIFNFIISSSRIQHLEKRFFSWVVEMK